MTYIERTNKFRETSEDYDDFKWDPESNHLNHKLKHTGKRWFVDDGELAVLKAIEKRKR